MLYQYHSAQLCSVGLIVTVLMHYSVKEREPVGLLQQIFTNVEKSQKLTNF